VASSPSLPVADFDGEANTQQRRVVEEVTTWFFLAGVAWSRAGGALNGV
jgi:hypothetical protein